LDLTAVQDKVRRQEAELREVNIKVAKAVAEAESARQEHAKAHSDAEKARQEKDKAVAAAEKVEQLSERVRMLQTSKDEKVDQLEQQVGMLKAEVAHEKRERFGSEEKVGQLSEKVRGLQAVHQFPSAPAVQYQVPSPRPRLVGRTELDADMTQHPRVPGVARWNQQVELHSCLACKHIAKKCVHAAT
jgi:chromosome segregation ATPase